MVESRGRDVVGERAADGQRCPTADQHVALTGVRHAGSTKREACDRLCHRCRELQHRRAGRIGDEHRGPRGEDIGSAQTEHPSVDDMITRPNAPGGPVQSLDSGTGLGKGMCGATGERTGEGPADVIGADGQASGGGSGGDDTRAEEGTHRVISGGHVPCSPGCDGDRGGGQQISRIGEQDPSVDEGGTRMSGRRTQGKSPRTSLDQAARSGNGSAEGEGRARFDLDRAVPTREAESVRSGARACYRRGRAGITERGAVADGDDGRAGGITQLVVVAELQRAAVDEYGAGEGLCAGKDHGAGTSLNKSGGRRIADAGIHGQGARSVMMENQVGRSGRSVGRQLPGAVDGPVSCSIDEDGAGRRSGPSAQLHIERRKIESLGAGTGKLKGADGGGARLCRRPPRCREDVRRACGSASGNQRR